MEDPDLVMRRQQIARVLSTHDHLWAPVSLSSQGVITCDALLNAGSVPERWRAHNRGNHESRNYLGVMVISTAASGPR
jgi:hypothetical protein